MKKLTKITLTIITLSIALFSFSACQEDVVPTLDNTEVEVFSTTDVETETDPDDKDEGVIPRLQI